jgi:Tat protein translocase TatB subunit
MFDLGVQELVVIFLVALLVFGPKKLPELGRTLGKWMTEIRRGFYYAKAQIETEVEHIEKEVEHIEKEVEHIEKEVSSETDKPHPEEEKITENISNQTDDK